MIKLERDPEMYKKYLNDKEKYDKSRTDTSNGSND